METLGIINITYWGTFGFSLLITCLLTSMFDYFIMNPIKSTPQYSTLATVCVLLIGINDSIYLHPVVIGLVCATMGLSMIQVVNILTHQLKENIIAFIIAWLYIFIFFKYTSNIIELPNSFKILIVINMATAIIGGCYYLFKRGRFDEEWL